MALYLATSSRCLVEKRFSCDSAALYSIGSVSPIVFEIFLQYKFFPPNTQIFKRIIFILVIVTIFQKIAAQKTLNQTKNILEYPHCQITTKCRRQTFVQETGERCGGVAGLLPPSDTHIKRLSALMLGEWGQMN